METEDLTFEPAGCTHCGEVASVLRYSRGRVANFLGARHPVTEAFRRCTSCGEVVTNTKDHDWRQELRDLIHADLPVADRPRLPGAFLEELQS